MHISSSATGTTLVRRATRALVLAVGFVAGCGVSAGPTTLPLPGPMPDPVPDPVPVTQPQSLCPPLAERSGLIADPNYDQATTAMQGFVGAHLSSWVVAESRTDPASQYQAPTWEQPCGAASNNLSVAEFSADGLTLQLYFDCTIKSAKTLGEVRAAYRFTVLDALPTGVAVPNWQFQVYTPVSSFSKGVELVSLTSGQLTLQIQTPLFLFSGHSTIPACIPPADAPTEPCCYVSYDLQIPLTLTLSAPFDPSLLR